MVFLAQALMRTKSMLLRRYSGCAEKSEVKREMFGGQDSLSGDSTQALAVLPEDFSVLEGTGPGEGVCQDVVLRTDVLGV